MTTDWDTEPYRPEPPNPDGPNWNGEPCEARRVRVVIADAPRFPSYWARDLVGQEREAVEVVYNGQTFYIDNADGSGWVKVTEGMGSYRWPHRGLDIEHIVAESSEEGQM